jgi:hypothetical protein
MKGSKGAVPRSRSAMRVPRPGPSSTSLILLGLPACCHTVRHQIPIICAQSTVWRQHASSHGQAYANTDVLEPNACCDFLPAERISADTAQSGSKCETVFGNKNGFNSAHQQVKANLQATMYEIASSSAEAPILHCHSIAARHSEHEKTQKSVKQQHFVYLTK